MYEGVPNEWVPALLPSETYVHHTLQRSLAALPQILSPTPAQLAAEFIPEEDVMYMPEEAYPISQYSPALANEHCSLAPNYSSTMTRRGGGGGPLPRYSATPTSTATLGRNNASPIKLGTTTDEMNDAYYTYNARRAKGPATTFN